MTRRNARWINHRDGLASDLMPDIAGKLMRAFRTQCPERALLWMGVACAMLPSQPALRGADAPADTTKIASAESGATLEAKSDWWSLQALSRPSEPSTPHIADPIDAFIIAKLADKGLRLSPEAS